MKNYNLYLPLVLLVNLGTSSLALPRLDMGNLTNGDLLGCFVPNSDGMLHLITAEEEIFETEKVLAELANTVPEVRFFLYTRLNPKVPQELNNTLESIENSNFDGSRPGTRVFAHGWMGSLDFPSNKPVLNAWLRTGDYNVFIIDWGQLAQSLNALKVRLALPTIAAIIADFLLRLNQNFGMSYDTLHVVGHSLGAHIAGFTGKQTIRLGHKIGTIVGLDAASQCTSYTNTEGRLADTDAVYVESIHASSPFTGFKKPIGLASFYVNGAGLQPICQTSMWPGGPLYLRVLQYTLDITCSHLTATSYYANAISCRDSVGHLCSDYTAALNGECNVDASDVRMGAFHEKGADNLKNSSPGVYYVDTKRSLNSLSGKCEKSSAARNSGMLIGILLSSVAISIWTNVISIV